jgi:hypothetical protein
MLHNYTIRISICILAYLFLGRGHVSAQKKIENYLVEKQLIGSGQLKTYHKKIREDKEYVMMMARMMKKDNKAYARELETELAKETAQREKNNDTLSVLSVIIETTTEKKYFNDPGPDSIQKLDLKTYTQKLVSCRLITISIAVTINGHIDNNYLSNSYGIVTNAIGLRDKARSTVAGKLKELMDILRKSEVLSEEKYKHLLKESIPDSVNKIKYIVSQCEKTILTGSPFATTKGKENFLPLVNELSRLTGIEIEEINARLIPVSGSMGFSGIPVIEFKHQGKIFTHKCYGVSTTDNNPNPDPYTLIGHDFYRIFNRILALKRVSYRLHRINENNTLSYIHMPWYGFIILNRNQSEKLYRNEHLELSYEDNINPLTDAEIARAVSFYKEAGLLTRLSQSTIDSAIAETKQDPVFRYNELVARLPVVSLVIEERIPISAQDAIGLLKKMAAISDHGFNPGNPRIEKGINGADSLKFEWRGITFSEEFKGGWMGVWSSIHNAVFGDLNRNAQFEALRIDQDRVVYIFIPYQKSAWLKKQKVIGDY